MEDERTAHDASDAAMRLMQGIGISATMPRVAVWKVLAWAERPLQATEIKRRLQDNEVELPLSSIYSALKKLTAVKLVVMYSEAGSAHYSLPEKQFCQRITCGDSGQEYWFSDAELSRTIARFCRKHGFVLSDYMLFVNGKHTGTPKDR